MLTNALLDTHHGVTRCDHATTNAAVFTQFIERCTTAISLDDLAKRNGVSRASMKRRFTWRWLIDVPDPTADHS